MNDDEKRAYLAAMSDDELVGACAFDDHPDLWAEAARRDAEMIRKIQEERR
jgi:hypothetical protein